VKYAILIALMIATGCSVNHASEQYACDQSHPCEGGRVCDNGFCIVKGSIDASTPGDGPRGDGGNAGCPPGCTSCSVQQKTCTIDCAFGGCQNTVTCPQGYSCNIKCGTDNSCRNGVNCALAKSCDIECSGKASCQGVQCGAGRCNVACTGTQSCRGVACSNSCACDVECTGTQACDGVVCSSLACRVGLGPSCTSSPDVCHSCQ